MSGGYFLSDIKGKKNSEFLGLANLPANYKRELFDLIYYYQFILKLLRDKYKLGFAGKNISGVVGVLSSRNDYVDQGCILGDLIISGSLQRQTDYLGDFDFSLLDKIVREMKKVSEEISVLPDVNIFLKFFIWIRYSDWRRNLMVFAKWFLGIFLFLSILYFLVTTELGRQLAWDFLAVYNVVVRILMVILLIVAVVLIVGIVSFMYFEGKSNKK